MPKLALTQTSVKTATCKPNAAKTDYFDTKLRNFGLEVRKNKKKSFFIRYVDQYGKTRQMAIGDADLLTAQDGRTKARDLLREIELGHDPRAAKVDKKGIPTVSEFKHIYLNYVKGTKKTWYTDESLLRHHVIPSIGKKRLDELTATDFLKLQSDMRDNGYANGTNDRVQVLCRYMLNLAKEWGTFGITTNPAAKIALLNRSNVINRYLSKEEIDRLLAVLDEPRWQTIRPIILIALATGARRGEVMRAEWDHIDLDKATWLIPETKSGKPLLVPLCSFLVDYLTELRSTATTRYVCPSPRTGKPYNHIYWSWNQVRTLAGLADVRFHDLRHTFASVLINNRRSLYEVQHLLGHTQSKTTQRYAHLAHETLQAASDTVGTFLQVKDPTTVVSTTPDTGSTHA
jgi:integrase